MRFVKLLTPDQITQQLEFILPTVQKPGRYVGGELNQVTKVWDKVETRLALVFPDIYDIGMSNLGMAILYELVNDRTDTLAERVYAPWEDMEVAMRKAAIPLFSLESKRALADFDIVGFSLPYETLYTNTLNLLDLGGIPLLSADRTSNHPLVIAGGHSTYNPEPMHLFIDAFVIGEGEDVIHEIINTYQSWRKCNKSPRFELLLSLSQIWGVYVPSLYKTHYNSDGSFSHIEKYIDKAPLPVVKRIVPKLPPPPTKLIVPYIDTVHNRFPIEIMRGCTRGCRFCHAGMVTRPVRERPVEEIISAIKAAIKNTGFEEIGLLSLSSSDYTQILDLVNNLTAHFNDQHLSTSLPSLRIESFSVELMDALKGSRKGGFTLAPEAATERMREIINKPVRTDQLLETARQIFSRGWSTIKLYFMIGHPSETIEDVHAIVDLCKSVLAEGRTLIGGRAKVTAGVSTFVPKPHTPFQWVPCDTIEQINEKQALLKRQLRGNGLKLNWVAPEETMLEAWLSRGDRRLAEVIYQAWQSGAKFDAWGDQFQYDIWLDAFEEVGLDPFFYTLRERPLDETFPWEHIDSTLRKKFLTEDYLWSQQGRTRIDCRERCFACGILPTYAEMRRMNPGEVWQCPEVKSKSIRISQFIPSADITAPTKSLLTYENK
jgi:radical SAM family uncharacterized protein